MKVNRRFTIMVKEWIYDEVGHLTGMRERDISLEVLKRLLREDPW